MSESNVERFINQYAAQTRESCPDIPQKAYPHMFRIIILPLFQICSFNFLDNSDDIISFLLAPAFINE